MGAAHADVLDDLGASVRRYVGARRNDSSAWRDFADLGWLGAAVDEDHGGFGGPAEMSVVARELGSGLIDEPYLEACVVPTTFLAAAVPLAEHGDLLAKVISADVLVATVFNVDEQVATLECLQSGNDFVLNGRVGPVLGGASANFLIAVALDQRGRRVIALIDCSAPGVSREVLPTIDGREAAFVTLDQVRLQQTCVWPQDERTTAAVALAIDTGIVAQGAQLIGVMDRSFELTRSYLLTRRQFGQSLAEFQVLRHRLADMYAELEQARSLVSSAVEALGSKSTAQRSQLASACKVRAIRAARVVGAQSIQLHGAIALTEEYEVGRCYKRLLVLEKTWGDLDFHVQRFASAAAANRKNT